MPLIADDGHITPTVTQIFVHGKYLSECGLPDAKDTVDAAFDGLSMDLTWTTGVKRLFYTPPKDMQSHIHEVKGAIFTILDMTGEMLMTNHLPRREMYLYYTTPKVHDLEYADAGYMCFEVPIESASEVATLIGVASILARKDDPSRPVISAAEATKAFHRGTIKIKLMPLKAIEDNWGALTDILGDDLIGFFESHHKS